MRIQDRIQILCQTKNIIYSQEASLVVNTQNWNKFWRQLECRSHQRRFCAQLSTIYVDENLLFQLFNKSVEDYEYFYKYNIRVLPLHDRGGFRPLKRYIWTFTENTGIFRNFSNQVGFSNAFHPFSQKNFRKNRFFLQKNGFWPKTQFFQTPDLILADSTPSQNTRM